MGKTTRLALVLVLIFVIGAAVLLDGKSDKDDDKSEKKEEPGAKSLAVSQEVSDNPWGLQKGREKEPASGRSGGDTGTLVDVPDHRASTQGTGRPEPEPPVPGGARTYKVVKDDTLAKISKAVYGSDRHWQKLLDANKDKIQTPKDLKPDMVLVIPDLVARTELRPEPVARESRSEEPRPPASAGGKTYHVVQSGERLWDIAKKYYGSGNEWRRIHEANRDVLTDPSRVRAGTRLLIPERPR